MYYPTQDDDLTVMTPCIRKVAGSNIGQFANYSRPFSPSPYQFSDSTMKQNTIVSNQIVAFPQLLHVSAVISFFLI
jgi:hypothetical protein